MARCFKVRYTISPPMVGAKKGQNLTIGTAGHLKAIRDCSAANLHKTSGPHPSRRLMRTARVSTNRLAEELGDSVSRIENGVFDPQCPSRLPQSSRWGAAVRLLRRIHSDWPGPDFLQFYVVIYLIGLAGADVTAAHGR